MFPSILLIGQSNMAGRGKACEVEAIKNNKITVYRNGFWRDFYIPVNTDCYTAGVNLSESFADTYVKEHDCDCFGIIPCAVGNTSVSQWQPGETLFDHAVNCAKICQRSSEIVAILWHQGEADCSPERYPLYEEKMLNIINTIRCELKLPDVPFLVGGLGEFLEECPLNDKLKNYVHINATLKKIAEENHKVGYVSSEALTSNPDFLHFNAKSLREFGLRYYEQFKKMR